MRSIEAQDLVVRKGGRRLLDGLSVRIEAGELVGVIGPNGSGKTTLLRVLAHLERPSAGHVRLDGCDLAGLGARERARRIGYHAQEPELHWPLPVASVVALGRLAHARGLGALGESDRAVLDRVVEQTALGPLLGRRCDTLSGGERARVHIARVLAGEPELLLADEPIANLDPRFQAEILALLRASTGRDRATVVVLHDLNVAARCCDRLILLARGTVHSSGAPEEVLTERALATVFEVSAAYRREAGIEQALAERARRRARVDRG